MQAKTTRVPVSDGVTLAVHAWQPDDGAPVRGVLHLVHGLAEHAKRYDRLARALVAHGWIVYAHDQRGHGGSVAHDADLGFAPGGWRALVEDIAALIRSERAAHPGAPFVLMAHSMGSFVAQEVLFTHPEGIDAVVLSGSNGRPGPLAQAGRLVARLERVRLGARGRSKLLDTLSFGGFNKPFAPTRTSFDWLSRDGAEVDRYIADPHCGFLSSTATWVDMTDALVRIAKPANVARVPKHLPMYVFSGSRDPVGEHGAGVSRLVDAYRSAGLDRVTFKLYPEARHETLNETHRDEVTADLVAWLDANVPSSA